MNEKELADELQAHKDDATEWGEAEVAPESSKRTRQRLAAMVSVRFTPDELERVQQRAHQKGQTVSAYLRSMAVGEGADLTLCSNFDVSISSETYSARVANRWLMSDGRSLATSHG